MSEIQLHQLLAAHLSGVTVSAGDVLQDKYFYNASGERTAGTIQSLTAQTITPNTADQIIPAGKYLAGAQTVSGDANLTASNIKKDVTIFGVTGTNESGTDTSDTTAVAGDVAEGKYFYSADGTKTAGTLAEVTQPKPTQTLDFDTGIITAQYTPVAGLVTDTTTKSRELWLAVQAAQTFVPNTADQYVGWHRYLTGQQTIKGDSNLIAANIKKSVRIFNVTGTYEGTASFYKCASASNGTWTGYKAVLTDGVYSFSSAVTTGLTYTTVTPNVGSIYTQDALATISSLYTGLPTDGLIFYAPLIASSATAETGQTMTTTGAPVFGEVDGISCCTFATGDEIETSITDVENYSTASFSVWIKWNPSASSNNSKHFTPYNGDYGYSKQTRFFSYGSGDNRIRIDPYGFDIFPTANTWSHVCWTFNGTAGVGYINGVSAGSGELGRLVDGGKQFFIHGDRDGASPVAGSYAAMRVYNRVLTANEVSALAAEFTPTAS